MLARALGAFPVPLRTLDALHLASLDYLRGRRQAVELASYDRRMTAAARAMGIPVHDMAHLNEFGPDAGRSGAGIRTVIRLAQDETLSFL